MNVDNEPNQELENEVVIKNEEVNKVKEESSKEEVTNEILLEWKELEDYTNIDIPFIPTEYSPKVPKYKIASDLSNIENIYRFDGFSEKQMKKLIQNGFIVLEPNPDRAYIYMKMYDVYETNEYLNIPSFITVDSAIHMYHKFFDETLKQIEKEDLLKALDQLSSSMLEKSIDMYRKDSNIAVKQELEHSIIYFSVANKLINDSYGELPDELLEIAKKEIEKIEESEGYGKSPLFGFDINYEQFIPRGHYDGDEQLEKYFKTMMWYGLIGYPFKDEQGNLDYDSISKALLITYISFLNGNKNEVDDITLWDKIYAPTNFFVGQSDDITIFDLKEVIINVYGELPTPADFKDESYNNKLAEEIKKLPTPQIQHKLITGAVDTPTDKQFRFMGQRYTLDADIMQNLMFPIERPVPTGLDVAGAFGNKRAEEIAKENYLHNITPEKYSKELKKMKDKVEALELKDWQQNLYNGWLWVLKSVWSNKEDLEGLPIFMKNQAWYDKNIQTGLGSYAELKHDTVLYAKQPVAEMGGGEEPKDKFYHYVEPNVEVYDRLLWLVKFSKTNLEKRNLLSERREASLNSLERIYELLRDCSVKELENIPITEDENNSLRFIGGALEGIDASLAEDYQKSLSSAIISDVAGLADVGMFLEIGTGLPNEIYVVVQNQGRVYLTRGFTYSYYEFLSEKPLTDRQWQEGLGIEKIEEGDWSYQQINPEKLLKNVPPQPSWMESFKSFEENRVNISTVEYMIDQQ